MHGQGGSLLFEENPATTTDYLYLLDKPFGKVEDGEVYYYATDHLGTVTAITDAAGQAVWKDDATPFGENTGIIGTRQDALRFTGKSYDDGTTGRFITEDPAKDGLSWYVYAGNNPVGWIDPSGLEDVPFNTVSGPLPLIDEVETGDQWYNTVFDTVAAGAAGIYNWGASAANMAINGLGGTAEKAQEFYEAADDATGGELSYLLEPAMLYLGTAEGMAAMAAFEEYLAAKTALNAGKAATDQSVGLHNRLAGSFDEILSGLDEASFKTSEHSSVFWTGYREGNQVRAMTWAQANGKMTIEMTPGGKALNALDLYSTNSSVTRIQADTIWNRASEMFANNASGTVNVFTEGALAKPSVFFSIELPLLRSNPKVGELLFR